MAGTDPYCGIGVGRFRVHEDFYKTVGANIRSARRRKEISQEVLAKAVGLTRTSLTNIEKGRQKVLAHTLALLSEKLEVSIEDLMPQQFRKGSVQELKLPADLSEKARFWIEQVVTGTGKT